MSQWNRMDGTIFRMNITWLTFRQSPLSLAFMLFMFSPLVNRQNVSPHFFCFTSFPLLSVLRNTHFLLPFFLQKQLLWHNTVTLQWAVSIFFISLLFPFLSLSDFWQTVWGSTFTLREKELDGTGLCGSARRDWRGRESEKESEKKSEKEHWLTMPDKRGKESWKGKM